MAVLFTSPVRSARVAVAHLFATGAYRPDTKHGLLHLGVLPLEPGAKVQQWLLNPERDYSAAVSTASGVANARAKEAPTWAEVAEEAQAALGAFDALLIMDRAGQPSPERLWLEQHVLAGMAKPPMCVGLDELLAFFLPNEVLDDADELLEKLVAQDKAVSEKLGYAKRNDDGAVPQLPFMLHAMRRAVRRVLESLLQPQGQPGQQWLPGYTLLDAVISLAPRRPELRAFRLLKALAQQPDCCDDTARRDKPNAPNRLPLPPPQPAWPQPEQMTLLLNNYLSRWRDKADDSAAPELGLGDVSEQQVEEAFEQLAKRMSSGKHPFQPRPQQLEYARFIARAVGRRGAFAIEAGTGTGKTFGYLVPALEYLRHAPEALVVVATSTKNLQEQMRQGELPALLREVDGRRTARYKAIRTATLKGKNCYLCVEALGRAFDDCLGRGAEWPAALAWFYLALRLRDTEGETEGIARPLSAHPQLGPALRQLLRRVTADRACRHGALPGRKACVYPAHRLRAEQANLLIVNHHKLALLPPKVVERATVCVVDEADRFPDNFRSALARSLDARELHDELLEPLLHGQPMPNRNARQTAEQADTPAKTQRRAEPFLNQLRERLRDEEEALWRQVPAADQPGPDDASRAAYEAFEEARLEELGAKVALLEQVAELMRETPAALDARQTADAAWMRYAIEAAPYRRRQAVRTALHALTEAAVPLQESLAALGGVSSQFQNKGGRPAALPFPIGETHWHDNVRVEQPGRAPLVRPFHRELVAALPPLSAPLKTSAKHLGQVRRHLAVALNINLAEDEDGAPTDPDDDVGASNYDERLCRRTERFAEIAEGQAEVLERLLEEFPCREYVPVVVREPETNGLGWQLVRQPYALWPYLGATPDPETGEPLQQASDETSEQYTKRLLAARAALRRMSGEPATPLFDQFRTVVFTSATLYVENHLGYFKQLLDMRVPFAAEQRILPIFDYDNPKAEPVLGGVPTYLPMFRASAPPQERRAWCEAQLRTLLPLLITLEGRTLVLFTSNEEMRYAADWLEPRLAEHDIELLMQNGASQWEIRRFRRVEQTVLLGVDRMWTGVDFAGPTLSQVVVWRLPFPSLGEPLISHRKRYEADETFWGQFYRPAARLKLRQGFGRLVRRQRDRGAFIILDRRVAAAFYADVLSEFELKDFQHFTSPERLLEQTTGPLLHLLQLGEDFKRRELSVERLLELSRGWYPELA
ncbi:ATP-dependent DNA helicase [Hymenobacter oligotrophus]|uniref:ATP-dependent DNA helicase n=1 Tax=Hymenobacter oligotrophus TaxID=2319843 RepID=A0A3B7QYY0_9BACT|nr:ATP-dependent DNA helicase [Hymenobacter oligotrophus]